MGIVIDEELCEGCGKCVPKCTHHALRMAGPLAVVNNKYCTDCGICIDYCPSDAMDLTENVVGDTHESEDLVPDESGVKRVVINADNPCIERAEEGCDDCHSCVKTCRAREKKLLDPDFQICLGCGQCIHTCEGKVLHPRNSLDKVLEALQSGRTCIAYTAPGTRVALGDDFGEKPGTNVEGRLVSALRAMGFQYVLDVNFAADVTIIEEANELIRRINGEGTLPMFTSCCPAWISYAEYFYPDLLDNISTCKSPIGMEGALIDSYFTKFKQLDSEDVFTVALTPCTAKKGEILRPEITGTDAVLTIQELSSYIKTYMDFEKLQPQEFDSFMGTGSGAGAIFGNTGGVCEAALRTAYHTLTGQELDAEVCEPLHGMNDFKEITLKAGDVEIHAAVVNEMSSALPILDSVRNGTCQYQFIEIMNCRGGCIGGGGQPLLREEDEFYVKKNRIETLYKKDQNSACRTSHGNPEVQKLYKDYLGEPGSPLAESLLHTGYNDRSSSVKKQPIL